MDFFDVVKSRHSYRGRFQDKPIPKKEIDLILEAGIRAPSGCNMQTTSFLVVTDPEMRAKIGDLMELEPLRSAPVILAILTEEVVAPRGGMVFEKEDYGAAVQNILLAVTALGYASVWLDGVIKRDGRDKVLAKELGVPANLTLRCLLPIGVAEAPGVQAERKSYNERVIWERFSSEA